jgi:hypothetical protein
MSPGLIQPEFLKRIGLESESIAAYESAGWRHSKAAESIVAKFPLEALYLWGYVVECYLKSACFELANYPRSSPITKIDRELFEAQGYQLLNYRPRPHDPSWYGEFLIEHRRQRRAPISAAVERDLRLHLKNLDANWAPLLRYTRAHPVSNEIKCVRDAANWFKTYRTKRVI